MEAISIIGEEGVSVDFHGQLIHETEDYHQVEKRHPYNTETVRLFKTSEGRFVLSLQFQFEDMYPHHQEVHFGNTPAEILESLAYPTEATKRLFEEIREESLS